jgi:hypothetical protein
MQKGVVGIKTGRKRLKRLLEVQSVYILQYLLTTFVVGLSPPISFQQRLVPPDLIYHLVRLCKMPASPLPATPRI